jgi:hypothetical protein
MRSEVSSLQHPCRCRVLLALLLGQVASTLGLQARPSIKAAHRIALDQHTIILCA